MKLVGVFYIFFWRLVQSPGFAQGALCEELCGGSLAVPGSTEVAGASRVGILGLFAAVLSQGILNRLWALDFS